MASPITLARSLLFVPATRPERFARALDSGADSVILDLEDAVPPGQKDAARSGMGERLQSFTPDQLARTLVRINAIGTQWHGEDLRLAGEWCLRGLGGVMLPKAESGAIALRPSAWSRRTPGSAAAHGHRPRCEGRQSRVRRSS